MVINDLSHLEDIADNQSIIGGASGLVNVNAFIQGYSGYTSTLARLIKEGSIIIGKGHSVAVGVSFSQSSSSIVISGDS